MIKCFMIVVYMGYASSYSNDTFKINAAVLPTWTPFCNTAIKYTNASRSISSFEFTLGETRSKYDKMLKALAKLEDSQIHVVFGPYDDAIAMVTEKLRIPYISMTAFTKGNLNSTFQMIPSLSGFSQAIMDMMKMYKWERVSLFYDNEQGVYVMERLLTNHELMVKTWRLNKMATHEEIKNHLVLMRRAFVQKSVIFCNRENTRKILEQARDLAILSNPNQWFFYDPGYELEPVFAEFKDVLVNFTLFGLIDHWTKNMIMEKNDHRLELALTTDGVELLNRAYHDLVNTSSDDEVRIKLLESIQQAKLDGFTGHVQFGPKGRRQNYSVILKEITDIHNYQIGKWESDPSGIFEKHLQLQSRKPIGNRTTPFALKGRKVKVVMILEKPFTMFVRDRNLRLGKNVFEGFAVDLIAEVAKMLDFDYDIYIVEDGMFGNIMDNGEWNGMIGELLSGNAAMSVAPLSINSKREEAVDFTKPFMTRYISVLMKVPRSERSYFEFLNPLHPIVWFCTFGAFVVVSIILYMLEKVGRSYYKDYSNISFRESFWFVFGSLLQGSTDTSPSTLPGRILTSAWWFFALILISSYTANLAAFLTVKKINAPIKSVTDLASQTKIKYGTVESSGIMSFFKNTDIEHFTKMWAQMSEVDRESMVRNTSQGFDKVKQGNYAFFWDTTVNKYMTIEDCELIEIGPPFDPKGFGIGVPPGATYREELSMAILTLSDTGFLHQLENKWWGRRNCPDFSKPSADETSELQIENVAGVFFILVSGVGLAGLVCGVEYFMKMLQKAAKLEKQPQNAQNSKERESFL